VSIVLGISSFYVGGPPLQPRVVGLFLGTGCMLPQPFTTGGSRSYLEVFGRHRRPMVHMFVEHIRHMLIKVQRNVKGM
jgi:hypothetical protein